MAERAYPEELAYVNKTKYYYVFIERYKFGVKYTKDKIVLDVPCGSGWGTSLIDNANEVYGVDISLDAIQYARSHFKGIFSQGSMCKLLFEDNKFDVALCFEGIEHITKEEGVIFINEIKRVVKRDGLIVGSVPILNKNGEDTGNPYHKFEYPEDYLRILLEENFKITEYINKKGGDGPIVYFALKNQLKHRVTILTSAYNSEKDIKGVVDTTLNQTFKDFKLIIINDDSAERTMETLQSYIDPRIKIINYEFKQGTDYNLKLKKELEKVNFIRNTKKYIRSILPNFAVRLIKTYKEKKHK